MVRVIVDGATRFERIVEPDPLRFWRWFQADVLRKLATPWRRFGVRNRLQTISLFSKRWISTSGSASRIARSASARNSIPQRKRSMKIATSARSTGSTPLPRRGEFPMSMAPARSTPLWHIRTGQGPGATISFRPRRTHAAYVTKDNGTVELIVPLRETALPQHRVTRFVVGDVGLTSVAIELSCESSGDEDRFTQLLKSLPSPSSGDHGAIDLDSGFAGSDEVITLPISRRERDPLADQNPASSMPGWRTILFNDDLPPLLAMIRELPGVHVWQSGRSYEGRPIWSFALTSSGIRGRWSPVKLSARKPLILIARVITPTKFPVQPRRLPWSSSFSATRRCSKRPTIVVIPIENPDGVAFHGTLSASPSAMEASPCPV